MIDNIKSWHEISKKPLTEDFIREKRDKVIWNSICEYQKLSEDFMREFKDELYWNWVTINQKISEEFIEEFQDKIYWDELSDSQLLSEEFLRKFKHKGLNWILISKYQNLSEDFIREFQDKLDWQTISKHQILSEDFIEEFKDKICWYHVSKYQTLSLDFMLKNRDKLNWLDISKFQNLAEDSILLLQDKLYWPWILWHQKLSDKLKNKMGVSIFPNECWLYTDTDYKLKHIKENTNFTPIDNQYIIAYKAVDKYNRSIFLPARFRYEIGKTYHSKCDCNQNITYTYGLSAGTRKHAKWLQNNGNVLEVKININDIGYIDDDMIRCSKLTVLG